MPCAGFIAVSCCHQRTDAPKLRNRQRSISIELNVCIVSGVWCEIWRFSIDDIVAQKYGTNRIKIAYPCALITKSRMFDKMLKCSLDGKSPVNGLQEKGKYIFIRTPSKEDSYKHLSTNMREHNNHLLSEEHNEDRLGRRDSQVIQESTDRSIILCGMFLRQGPTIFFFRKKKFRL